MDRTSMMGTVERFIAVSTVVVAVTAAHFTTKGALEREILGLRKDAERRDERSAIATQAMLNSIRRMEADISKLSLVVDSNKIAVEVGLNELRVKLEALRK